MSVSTVTVNDIKKLRESGLLQEGETVVMEGDLLLAVNPVTQERRLIETDNLLLECKRQILKG